MIRPLLRDQAGMAVVEFLLVLLPMAVALAYGITTTWLVHVAASTARTAAAAAALTVARGDASPATVDRMVATHWRDSGLEIPVRAHLACRPVPCGTPGGVVRVSVRARVPLPLIPGSGASIAVEAEQAQVVDRFHVAHRATP